MNNSKVVFVTGASSGLGLGIARKFQLLGYKVYGGYHSADRKKLDKNLTYIKLDVTDDASCQRAVRQILKKEKRIDILVNCAGISPSDSTLDFSSEQFIQTLQVNLIGPFRLVKEVLPKMGKGSLIVNVTSLNGFLSLPHSGVYSASKFALEALSFAVRQEMAEKGIEIVTVAPGAFLKEVSKQYTPMKHIPAREKFAILRWLFPFTSQKKVVDTIVDLAEGVDLPPRIIVGTDAKIAYALLKLLPFSWFDKIISYIWQKKGSLAFRS
ncbi:SDR family NAD(P)-dependent oxidoreductase [Patescibacteria group bacterium]|nr:SDR family NAD(P)-dependent oxidoreductase [Patescibacteria group bacterium]